MFLLEGSVATNAIPIWIARTNVRKIDKSLVISPCSSHKRIGNSNCIWLGRNCVYTQRWRLLCEPFGLEHEFSALQSKKFCKLDGPDSESSLDEPLPRPPGSEELKALLVDSDRTNLLRKLSEANQKNRFLKRQLLAKEEDLVNFKKEIAVVELEIQALVNLAKEISSYRIPDDSRKINGIYIQLHLLSRLLATHRKLEEQIKDISAAESKQVPLFWYGLAENVQVMGSFNGWTEGEGLSPEYTGTYTTFSTTLMLKPGRYEIKFLVDGDWQLSPEFPCVGEGLMQNNLLIVE